MRSTGAHAGAQWADRPRLSQEVEDRLFRGAEEATRFFSLKDLADVIELVRILELPEELAAELDPYVREKYREMWRAAQEAQRE
jgi:hypothetical protein